jgi:hypothetical protein
MTDGRNEMQPITVRVTQLPDLETSTHKTDNMNNRIRELQSIAVGRHSHISHLRLAEKTTNVDAAVTGYFERLNRHVQLSDLSCHDSTTPAMVLAR